MNEKKLKFTKTATCLSANSRNKTKLLKFTRATTKHWQMMLPRASLIPE